MFPNRNPNRSTSGRLTFLDWTRGVAVMIMLQGHVFHSFSQDKLRNDGPYVISQFFGGIGPAIFLVLTGITLAFLMDRRERDGLTPRRRWFAALGRSRYLFILAFLFRIQLWIFGYPSSPTPELLKVDILNCMGFAIGVFSLLAFLTTAERARWAAIIGATIAAASPVVSMGNWNWLPGRIAAYFVPSYTEFGFFPWAAFIAFGVSLGSILRLTKPENLNRVIQWVALAGIGVFFLGQYCSNFPYSLYAKQEFWLNSPWLVAMKLGPILILITIAYLWNAFGATGWSPVRQFGTTSLLVYWVHVELVYGRWFWFLKNNLDAAQCVGCALILILTMLALSVIRTRLKGRPLPTFSFSFPYFTYAQPRRVPGD